MQEKENKLWYLKNFNVFKSIPENKIEEIAGSTSMKKYSKDEILYNQGEKIDTVYVIKQGEVLLYHEKNDKKTIFDTLGPGSFFGAINPQAVNISHSAVAATGSKICAFSQKIIYKIIASYPQAMMTFWQEVANKIREYEERLSFNNASASDVIMYEIKQIQKVRQKGFLGFLKKPLIITHQELAKRTGLNRVTVTKEMKKLKETGKIDINTKNGVIEIL